MRKRKHPVPSDEVYQGGRKRAKELGFEFYDSGEPCKSGHYGYRRTGDYQCIPCAIAEGAGKAARYRLRHPTRKRVNDARTKSKRAGIPFDGVAYLEAWESRPVLCPALGILLSTSPASRNQQDTPEMDRLVPELGYVRGNIQVISSRANRMKNDGTASELRQIADWLDKESKK